MNISRLELPGLRLIIPSVYRDERGHFFESYQKARFQRAGIEENFVQDNHSSSRAHSLRGLHYQADPGQSKLVRCVSGSIFDVAVDLRASSPTYGKWKGVYLTEQCHEMLYIPNGFAHGFYVTSASAVVQYKCSSPYDPAQERTIAWDDPDLAIEWPGESPLLSPRDQAGARFKDFRPLTDVSPYFLSGTVPTHP